MKDPFGGEVDFEVEATGSSGGVGSIGSSLSFPLSMSLPEGESASGETSRDVSEVERVRVRFGRVEVEEVEAESRSAPGGGPLTPNAFAS